MPMSKKKFEELLITIEHDLYRKEQLDLSKQNLTNQQVVELVSAIKKNSYIKRVNLSGNKIGDEGAKALAVLKLQELNLSSNQLTSKGADALSKAKIESLDLSDNLEETTNLVENEDLDFELLESVNLSNSIGEIDVLEEDLSLEDVEKKSSEESTLVETEGFEEILSKIERGIYQKENLNLTERDLGDGDIIKLTSAIKKNTYIKKINLSLNKIGNKGATSLSELQLQELNLSCNDIGVEGASALSKAKIELLNLTANDIRAAGAICFSQSEYIKKLSLNQCGIGDVGAKAVLKNKKLKILDLSTNKITDVGVEKISIESSLIELNLSQNEITKIGAKSISKNKNIEILNLESNEIGDEGLESFVENNKLKKLNVAQNGITGKGCSNIFKNKKLEEINLFNNKVFFGEHDSLPKNLSFIKLNLSFNKLNGRCKEVLKALASIPTLKELNLTENDINKEGMLTLYRHKTDSLKQISMLGNPVEEISVTKDKLEIR